MQNFINGNQYEISSLSADRQELLAEGKLCFEETYTVEQFKAHMLVEKVQIKRKPDSSSLFFIFGGKTGPVSKGQVPANPMISLVLGQAKDKQGNEVEGMAEAFYLMHEEGSFKNAILVAEF